MKKKWGIWFLFLLVFCVGLLTFTVKKTEENLFVKSMEPSIQTRSIDEGIENQRKQNVQKKILPIEGYVEEKDGYHAATMLQMTFHMYQIDCTQEQLHKEFQENAKQKSAVQNLCDMLNSYIYDQQQISEYALGYRVEKIEKKEDQVSKKNQFKQRIIQDIQMANPVFIYANLENMDEKSSEENRFFLVIGYQKEENDDAFMIAYQDSKVKQTQFLSFDDLWNYMIHTTDGAYIW